MKIILTTLMMVFAFNANAFYTTFEEDVEALSKSVYEQDGTMLQKEQYLNSLIPVVRKARMDAYSRVASECIRDVEVYCAKYNDLDSKVKCLSAHKNALSSTCEAAVDNNFRKAKF
jgi:hypothetical protein